ncbi:peptide deformylase [Candidatus Vidania fulgoroideorum]
MINLINNTILYKNSYKFLNDYLYLNLIKISRYFLKGYAIAFVQLGIRKNAFSLYYCGYYFFFNSSKIWKGVEKYNFKEGCLSLSYEYYRKSSKYIYIECENNYKIKKKIFLKNFVSICFQHEYNHIIGKTGLIAQ